MNFYPTDISMTRRTKKINWEPVYDTVRKLYLEDGVSLDSLSEILLRYYGFVARYSKDLTSFQL